MSDSRTLRSFAGLAAGEAIARLLAFGATLIVARRLGPGLYGIVGVAAGIMLYLTQLADFGVELSGVPVVARARQNLTSLVSATLTGRLLIALAVTTAVVLLGTLVAPQPDGAILALYAMSLPFVALGVRWVFVGLQRTWWVAGARIGGELTALVLVLALVDGAEDLAVVPIATLLGAVVVAATMLLALRRSGVSPVVSADWSASRELFERGPHLVGFTLLGLVLFNADLIYLRFVTGEQAAGYYAAAYSFVAFSSNLAVAWAHGTMPAMAAPEQTVAGRDAVYSRAVLLAFATSLPVAVGGVAVATPLVHFVFGPEFEPAGIALMWLLPAIPLAAIREVVTAALITTPHGERRLVAINATSAVFNLLLLIPIVTKYGMIGAAIVTVLTELLRLALASLAARRAGFATVSWSRFARPAIAVIAMAAGLLPLRGVSFLVQIAVGAALYTAGLLALGLLRLGADRRVRVQL